MESVKKIATVVRNRVKDTSNRPARVALSEDGVFVGTTADAEEELVSIFGRERVAKVLPEEVPGPVHSNHNYRVSSRVGRLNQNM